MILKLLSLAAFIFVPIAMGVMVGQSGGVWAGLAMGFGIMLAWVISLEDNPVLKWYFWFFRKLEDAWVRKP
jgi:hypothetical protein